MRFSATCEVYALFFFFLFFFKVLFLIFFFFLFFFKFFYFLFLFLKEKHHPWWSTLISTLFDLVMKCTKCTVLLKREIKSDVSECLIKFTQFLTVFFFFFKFFLLLHFFKVCISSNTCIKFFFSVMFKEVNIISHQHAHYFVKHGFLNEHFNRINGLILNSRSNP